MQALEQSERTGAWTDLECERAAGSPQENKGCVAPPCHPLLHGHASEQVASKSLTLCTACKSHAQGHGSPYHTTGR